jgi:hypothetical protein
VLLLAIVAFGVPLAINLSARVNAEVRTQARAQADLVAATAADLLGAASRPELRTLAGSGANSIRGRILITDARGRVLADSNGPAQVGTSYASRPEVQAALHGRQVQVQRYSRTLETQILATAAPIIHEGRPVGAVRVTQGVASVQAAVLLGPTFYLRRRLGARRWRRLHRLTPLIWVLAAVHTLGAGSDASSLWLRGVVLLPVGPIVYLLTVRTLTGRRRHPRRRPGARPRLEPLRVPADEAG